MGEICFELLPSGKAIEDYWKLIQAGSGAGSS